MLFDPLKRVIALVLITFAFNLYSQGEPPELGLPSTSISDGSRIDVEERGYSIQPPVGWEITRNMNGASLYMQAEKTEDLIYQRNIRIMAFNGPEFIDEIAFKEYEEKIVENGSKMSNAIQDYRIRNSTQIYIANQVPAGLFYSEFQIDGTPMMQMHILASNADHHFIMTFTDLQEHFEQDNSPYLEEAFSALQSVEVDSLPPSRNSTVILIGIIFSLLIILLTAVKLFRKSKMKSLSEGIDEFEDEGEIEEEKDEDDIEVDDSVSSAISTISKPTKKDRKRKKSKKAQYEDDDDMEIGDFAQGSEDPYVNPEDGITPPQTPPARPTVPRGIASAPPPIPADVNRSSPPLPPPPSGAGKTDLSEKEEIHKMTLRKSKVKPKSRQNPPPPIETSGVAAELEDNYDEDSDDDWNVK